MWRLRILQVSSLLLGDGAFSRLRATLDKCALAIRRANARKPCSYFSSSLEANRESGVADFLIFPIIYILANGVAQDWTLVTLDNCIE